MQTPERIWAQQLRRSWNVDSTAAPDVPAHTPAAVRVRLSADPGGCSQKGDVEKVEEIQALLVQLCLLRQGRCRHLCRRPHATWAALPDSPEPLPTLTLQAQLPRVGQNPLLCPGWGEDPSQLLRWGFP